MSQLTEVIALISTLLPLLGIAFQLFKMIAQITHNKKLINLSERADVIVKALEQTDMMGEDKRTLALQKLAIYAKEVGIKVTAQQLEDYIESAVHVLKYLDNQSNK